MLHSMDDDQSVIGDDGRCEDSIALYGPTLLYSVRMLQHCVVATPHGGNQVANWDGLHMVY